MDSKALDAAINSDWGSRFNRQSAQNAILQPPQGAIKPRRSGWAKWLPTALGVAGSLAAAPLTGGASLLGTAAILGGGAALGSGLGEFGAQKMSGEKTDLGKIAREAAISGVTSAIPFGGAAKATRVAGKVAGEEALAGAGRKLATNAVGETAESLTKNTLLSKLGKAGTSLRKDVVNPKVLASPSGAAKEIEITKGLGKQGFKGSATKQYGDLPVKMNELGAELDTLVAANTNVGKRSALVKDIKTASNDVPYFVGTDPQHAKNLTVQIKELSSKLPTNFTAADAVTAKKELGSKMSGVFKKIEKGADLNPKEAAQYSVWKSLDNTITTIAPEAKDVTSKMSMLYEAAPGLKQASGKTLGVPLLGIKSKTAERAVQAGKDIVGRSAEKVAGVTAAGGKAKELSLLNKFIREGGKQTIGKPIVAAAGDMAGVLPSAPTQDPNAANAEIDALMGGAPGGADPMGGAGGVEAPQDPDEQRLQAVDVAIQQAMATGDTKGLANLLQVADYYQKRQAAKAETGLNSTSASAVTDMENGLANLDQLGADYAGSSANNPVTGKLRSLNPWDTEAKSIQSDTARVKQVIGKALEGGVLRKEDEIKYAKILPTLNDTDAVAAYKINAIKTDLARKLQLYKANIGAGGGGNDLSSIMATQSAGAY